MSISMLRPNRKVFECAVHGTEWDYCVPKRTTPQGMLKLTAQWVSNRILIGVARLSGVM